MHRWNGQHAALVWTIARLPVAAVWCVCLAAGVVAAEDGAEMDGAGVLAAEEEARRLGGNPMPGVLEGVLLVAPAGVLEGVLPFAAELPLGVSYAPAIRPPATGVSPPLPPLPLLFPADLPPPTGTGVRTLPPLPLLATLLAESSAGLPNETADSDRFGGAVPEACPDLSPLSPLDAMVKICLRPASAQELLLAAGHTVSSNGVALRICCRSYLWYLATLYRRNDPPPNDRIIIAAN